MKIKQKSQISPLLSSPSCSPIPLSTPLDEVTWLFHHCTHHTCACIQLAVMVVCVTRKQTFSVLQQQFFLNHFMNNELDLCKVEVMAYNPVLVSSFCALPLGFQDFRKSEPQFVVTHRILYGVSHCQIAVHSESMVKRHHKKLRKAILLISQT